MSTETYEGMTFVSSMRGWRYDRAKQNILLAVFASWIFFDDYFQRGELDWQGPAIMLLVWAVMSWPMRGFNKRRVFRSQVTIGEDHLDVVDAGVSARIPWRDILYIRIDRSLSGHRRNIRIRARGGRLFTLLDPEQGDLLESWAREVAKADGIKVKLRTWVTLNAEPVWVLFLFTAVMAAAHFTHTRGWI